MQSDLEKARSALAAGRLEEASVYAWNALAAVGPADAEELVLLARELNETRLLDELERRGISTALPEASPPPSTSKPIYRRLPVGAMAPILIVLAIVAVAITSIPVEPGPRYPGPEDATAPPRAGGPILAERASVWLVPVGEPTRIDLRRLADELAFRYRLPVGTLPDVALPAWTLDAGKRRLSSQAVIRLLQQTYAADGNAAIIGVTDYDMYDSREGLAHEFSLRAPPHHAVVSTSPLGARVLARLRGHDRHERTRKLIARNVGFLYFNRAVVDDPHSLLRSSMDSVDDIDKLHEDL
jgi:hypothetical protein